MIKEKIKTVLGSKILFVICKWVLGGIFIYAGMMKIMDREQFVTILNGYKLFPEFSIPIISIIIPWLEVIAGALLIAGIMEKFSAGVIFSLLIIFIIIILTNILRGNLTDCGCFSSGNKRESIWNAVGNILRDLLFLIPCIIILFLYPRVQKEDLNAFVK